MYKIRLEGIGGLGANLIGKLLGQIGFEYMNMEARAFSSYGSEKRGSPVKSYIYYSNKKILTNTAIKNPDLIGIFTPTLKEAAYGAKADTNIVVNTKEDFNTIAESLSIGEANLWLIDCSYYALEANSRINMVMLGAIAKASGFIKLEDTIKAVESTLVGEGNKKALELGYNNVKYKKINTGKNKPYVEAERQTLIGGINISNGSTVTNDLQGSRETYMPKYIREKCIDCGLCESTCPDMVFQFKNGVNMGLDLYHCKGCLRCTEICPTAALVPVENGSYNKNIGNINLENKAFDFDETGYSSLVEGEAYEAYGSTDKSI